MVLKLGRKEFSNPTEGISRGGIEKAELVKTWIFVSCLINKVNVSPYFLDKIFLQKGRQGDLSGVATPGVIMISLGGVNTELGHCNFKEEKLR